MKALEPNSEKKHPGHAGQVGGYFIGFLGCRAFVQLRTLGTKEDWNFSRFGPVIREIDSFGLLIHCYVPVGIIYQQFHFTNKTMGLPFLWTGSPTDLLWTCNLLENDSAFTKTSGQNSFMILWKDISAPRIQRASRCSRTLWPRSHVAIFRSFRILGDNGEQCLVSSIFGPCDASALLHRPWNDWGLGWVAQSVSCCIITCRFWLRVVCIPVSRNLCLEAENVQGAGCRVFLLLEEPLSSRNWGGTGVSFWEVVVVLKAEKLSRTWYAESSIFFLQLSFFSVSTFEKTSYLWVVAADPWFTRSFRVIVCWSSKCCDDGMAKKRIRRVAANIWSALMRRFKCLWLFQGGMVDMSGPHGSWNVSQTSGGLVFCLISHGGAEWRMIFLDIIFLSVPDTCGLRPSQQEELAPKVLQRMGSDVLPLNYSSMAMGFCGFGGKWCFLVVFASEVFFLNQFCSLHLQNGDTFTWGLWIRRRTEF